MIPQNGTSDMTELSVKKKTLIFCDKKQKYIKVFLPFTSGFDWNCHQAKTWSSALSKTRCWKEVGQ